jgi:hypothetical protein
MKGVRRIEVDGVEIRDWVDHEHGVWRGGEDDSRRPARQERVWWNRQRHGGEGVASGAGIHLIQGYWIDVELDSAQVDTLSAFASGWGWRSSNSRTVWSSLAEV